jgi:hypothetical protein
MSTLSATELYVRQDALTDPGAHAGLYDDLPPDPRALREIVSRLIIHVSWADKYGIPTGVPTPRDTQPVADRLTLIQSSQAGPLAAERPPRRRTFGTCRDFALVFCSMLRGQRIPARVRCGFATYLGGNRFEDHWICEYWRADGRRWASADAQLDQLHREKLSISFDCADLPHGAFLTACQAWQLARTGAPAPEEFGHGHASGLWFLRINLHRDLLALTNRHVSAWDLWRSASPQDKLVGAANIAACDRLAQAVATAEAASDGMDRFRELAADLSGPNW